MDKNDTIVTQVVIQALKMDDTIKKQEIMIERLKADKKELLLVISKMRTMLIQYAPEYIKQLDFFDL